jgi:GTP pyrophosphokinase
VGHQCIGAKVNRSIVPLKYQLQNGDTVEIITQSGHHPSKDWLKYTVTSRAISKIRAWIKTEERKKSVTLGRDLLEKEFRKHHLKFSQIAKSDELKKIYEEHSLNSLEDLLAIVGYGRISPRHVVNLFLPDEDLKGEEAVPEKVRRKAPGHEDFGISLTGVEDVMVRFAKCCNPIPGDEIIGYISRGRGITVHTANCPNFRDMDTERLVEVTWSIREKHTYPVSLRVVCQDKKGILAEISSVIAGMDVNISQSEVETHSTEMQAVCTFRMDVNDLQQFNQVVAALKKITEVLSAERVRGV